MFFYIFAACQKIAQQRLHTSTQCRTPTGSRPTTPQGTRLGIGSLHSLQSQNHSLHSHSVADQDQLPNFSFQQNNSHLLASPSKDYTNSSIQSNSISMSSGNDSFYHTANNSNFTLPHRNHILSASSHHIPIRSSGEFLSNEQRESLTHQSPVKKWQPLSQGISQQAIPTSVANEKVSTASASLNTLQTSTSFSGPSAATSGTKETTTKELPTPSSTPTTSRKSRRRSNLFIPSSKKEEKLKMSELGSGRAIPIKQGYLYKRSSNSLNKEWKKKYVTLCDDGRLTYHSSLHDYMDDSHGKEIALQCNGIICVTVKVPGQRPRGSNSILTNSTLTSSVNSYWRATNNAISDSLAGLTLPKSDRNKAANEKVLLTAYDPLRESTGTKANSHTSGDEGVVLSNSNSQTFLAGDNSINNNSKHNESQSSTTSTSTTANVKKRHKRMKSSGVKNELDGNLRIDFFTIE